MSSQNLMKDLESLQRQAKQAQETLVHSKNEVQAAQKDLKTLKSRLDAETETLLARRREQLEILASTHAETLDNLQKDIASHKEELASVLEKVSNSRDDLQAVSESKKQLSSEFSQLKADVIASTNELNDVRDSVVSMKSDHEALVSNVKSAQKELWSIQAVITELASYKEVLSSDISKLEGDFIDERSRLEEDIRAVEARLIRLRQEETEKLESEDETRKYLAAKAISLDERERVLRLREQKVEISEKKIRRNANLMNL